MADDEDDYMQDDYVRGAIEVARDSQYGRELIGKNANDLHILVAVQNDDRPISAGLEFSNFAALRNEQDADGMTPLMYAAQELLGDIILLLAGTQTGLRNNDDKTALQLFDEARAANPAGFPDDVPAYTARVRRALGAPAGGRRKKTRARKPKRRITHRRK
jgi:hypothetical protein